MKLVVKLFSFVGLLTGLLILSRVSFLEPPGVQAQQLSGEAAREYLASEGILAQLEGELLDLPPQGQNYGEPPPTTADDGAADDQFGDSVAVAGDTAVVGAPFTNINGAMDQGAVYAFSRTGTSWSQERKLLAVDGLTGGRFGAAVALDGNTAMVGAFRADVGGEQNQGRVNFFARQPQGFEIYLPTVVQE